MASNRQPVRVAVVTGASRGLGAEIAFALAVRGVHVAAVARTPGALEALDDRIRMAGGSATLVPLDLRDLAGIQRLAEEIRNRFRRLDILVHGGRRFPSLHAGSRYRSGGVRASVANGHQRCAGAHRFLRTPPLGLPGPGAIPMRPGRGRRIPWCLRVKQGGASGTGGGLDGRRPPHRNRDPRTAAHGDGIAATGPPRREFRRPSESAGCRPLHRARPSRRGPHTVASFPRVPPGKAPSFPHCASRTPQARRSVASAAGRLPAASQAEPRRASTQVERGIETAAGCRARVRRFAPAPADLGETLVAYVSSNESTCYRIFPSCLSIFPTHRIEGIRQRAGTRRRTMVLESKPDRRAGVLPLRGRRA